jgi:hypothetical protein
VRLLWLVPALLVVACDPFDRELSPSEARGVLEHTFGIGGNSSVATLAPSGPQASDTRSAFDAGVLEGLWQPVAWRELLGTGEAPWISLQLTDKGAELFKIVQVNRFGDANVELRRPIARKLVSVERVRDAGEKTKRSVDFIYRWDAPALLLRYIGRQELVNATGEFEREDGEWRLRSFTLGEESVPFRHDLEAEKAGRAERENRCRASSVATQSRGPYAFVRRFDAANTTSSEVEVSDAGFVVRSRVNVSGRVAQVLTRAHFWGDVLAMETRPGEIELTVLMRRSRTVGRFGDTYRISIAADGRSQTSLEAVGREMSEAWTAWHARFVGCLPEPTNAWDGN